jgi:hypothetical protein
MFKGQFNPPGPAWQFCGCLHPFCCMLQSSFLTRNGIAFLNFPLIIPIKNTYYTFQFSEIKYEDPMSSLTLTRLEQLREVAGKLSQTEAFMVSRLGQYESEIPVTLLAMNLGEEIYKKK